MTRAQLEKSIESSRIQMERSAKELDFTAAAKFRDEMNALKEVLKNKKS